MGLVTLTFDLLTLKLVCESHQRWGTFLPNLGTLGLWVPELFAMYATDKRADKSNGRGHNNFTDNKRTNRRTDKEKDIAVA